MEAAAHDPKFAAKAGIKPSVAKEFVQADTGRKEGARKKLTAYLVSRNSKS